MNESKEISALEMAKQKIPQAWYESWFNNKWEVQLFFAYSTIAYGALYVYHNVLPVLNSESYQIWPHFASLGLFLISDAVDTLSTIKGLNAINLASQKGVKHNIEEGSPLLAHVTTSRDLIYNPKSYYPTLYGSAVSLIVPFLGFPLAAFKTLATINNLRQAQRLNLAAEIAQNQSHLFPE